MRILWVPHTPWHVPQRAQFFVERLAERHQVYVTDWDGDFSGAKDMLTRRYALNLLPRTWTQGQATVHHVPRFSPALPFLGLPALNQQLFRASVTRLLERKKIDVVVGTFVTTPPEGVPTVADIVDDNVSLWLEQGTRNGYEQEIARHEEAWVERSHTTVVVSSVLADKVRARHPAAPVVRIPNGVDLDVYGPSKGVEAKRQLNINPSVTVVGNIGMIHTSYEAERLLAVAKRLDALPSVRLLVAGGGKMMPWLEAQVGRAGLDKVIFAGFVTGDTLVRAFQAVDVGLCPYKVTPGDDARVPMRLLHYSAVGARVVAPDLEELRRMGFSNVSLSEGDHDQFAEAVVTSLDQEAGVPDSIKHYHIQHLARQYEGLLEAAAAGKPFQKKVEA